MSLLRRRHVRALLLAAALAACSDSKVATSPHAQDPSTLTPSYTLSSGSASTLLGRATFIDPLDKTFKVKRATGDWSFEVKAKPAFDVAVQTIVFQPNGNSGWHRHPGPVFIQVTSGTMTFYESDDPTCTPVVRSAGEGFLDVGDHAHFARNETSTPAQNVVTYFAPPGAVLRIDAPNPGNCPF
jgi:hypothetical protein